MYHMCMRACVHACHMHLSHFVADFGADSAGPRVVDKGAGVAVVPMLVGELSVGDLECAQVTVQVFLFLEQKNVRLSSATMP